MAGVGNGQQAKSSRKAASPKGPRDLFDLIPADARRRMESALDRIERDVWRSEMSGGVGAAMQRSRTH